MRRIAGAGENAAGSDSLNTGDFDNIHFGHIHFADIQESIRKTYRKKQKKQAYEHDF